jgi:hypothetical protein
VALALPAAAAALWGASRLPWATEVRTQPGTGNQVTVAHTGAEVAPMLVPLAVLAVAAVAGSVAVGGWARRLLGAVVALAGAGAVWLGLAEGQSWGRVLAVLAGVLMLLAAALLIRFGARMPRLGAGYRTPDARRSSADADGQMWDGLSQGEDPTTAER